MEFVRALEAAYATLGVPSDIEPAQLKAHYKKLMRSAHPDKGGEASRATDYTAAFQLIEDSFNLQQHIHALLEQQKNLRQRLAKAGPDELADLAAQERGLGAAINVAKAKQQAYARYGFGSSSRAASGAASGAAGSAAAPEVRG